MTIKIKKSDSGVYWAEFSDGEVIAENSSSIDNVVQAALDLAGTIEFDDGKTTAGVDYDVSGTFTGFKLKSKTNIKASKNTNIRVPQGYAGKVFIGDTAYITPSVQLSHVTIQGLSIKEIGNADYLWTGYHFIANGDNHGIVYLKMIDNDIHYPDKGVLFESAHATGWINACVLQDVHVGGARTGFEFKKDAVGGIPFNAINRLNFTRCFHQSSSITEYGYKAIDGEGHVFDDCRVYDIHLSTQSTKKLSQFLSTANKIFIWGGMMTGTSPPTYMDWQCPRRNITVIDPFIDPLIRGSGKGVRTHPTSNDGKTATFTWLHGQYYTPTEFEVLPITPDANIGPFEKTADATNITIKYLDRLPPPTTPGNPIGHLKWYWEVKG
jgi:hypothetical protein